MARGFRHGFEPHWMWLDLKELKRDFVLRRDIRIEFDPDPETWDPIKNADYVADVRLARKLPDQAKRATAWVNGAPIGTACVFLTRGTTGIAGIYDVSVLPEYRNLGIGKAITHAVCAWAAEQGIVSPVSTPPRWAQTWQYPPDVQGRPLTQAQVQFAEAIGAGDIAGLERNAPSFSVLVNDVLPCKRTPFQLAALFKQPESAEWLVNHCALLGLLSTWELGWTERARELATTHPELVSARSGDWEQTPLHEAAMRGDPPFIQLLIDAGADLQARDGTFGGRPLEWAEHFGKTDAVALLKSATS